ncbi:hypothetical protein A3K86_16930 [Photobacterium jeanii]|uniref:Uncharacterized protein n=1 Tax=Photobacterium jeanii TaxID=858640 RepID=A0A178K8F4_9GAMM|nr:hypothetical protein [Photobacterium jeanii]OAN13336.1 hypothetical protein A3K86_16930 [Photobacterium jeanii]PST90335.1 hypothetical protein C9I91_06730 [Photobacterium jeanii]
MQKALETLKSFNKRVERLERSGFSKQFLDKEPEAFAEFKSVEFESLGNGEFSLTGEIISTLPDYNEDQIDAVILTYRVLTQNNDRLSIASISKIYNSDWFPEEGQKLFNEAREKVNEYLDSPATVSFPKGQISIRKLMEVIIYGGLAHSNKEKEEIYESWLKSGVSGFFQVEFVAALRFMIQYFIYFKDLNIVAIQLIENHLEENAS